MTDLLTLQRDIHRIARDHGFWEASTNIGEKLALIHSEVSEALEEYRDGTDLSAVRFMRGDVLVHGWDECECPTEVGHMVDCIYGEDAPKPEGFAVELADVVIRVLDLAQWLGIDMGAVVEEKMRYNEGREHLHGRQV